MKDPFKDKRFKAYADHFIKEVAPKLKASTMSLVLAPEGGTEDVKIALEIGYAILLNKLIVVIKVPGRSVAEKLIKIADHVIESDLTTDQGREYVADELRKIVGKDKVKQ